MTSEVRFELPRENRQLHAKFAPEISSGLTVYKEKQSLFYTVLFNTLESP